VKSIRTNPTAGAPEGDERIRTAVGAPGADPEYEALYTLRFAAAHGVSEGFYEREDIEAAFSRLRDQLHAYEDALRWYARGRGNLRAQEVLERFSARGAVS
jgi:hypothetical protein